MQNAFVAFPLAQEPPSDAPPTARRTLAQRLAELVVWPTTRISPHERQLIGDLLVDLLRTCPNEVRARCARDLARVVDAPKALLRYLARDEINVAGPLLENGIGFDDLDLVAAARASGQAHRLRIAARKTVSETVADALVQHGDASVAMALLRNPGARFAATTLDRLVMRAREAREMAHLLLRREELRAAQGFALFWWADPETRRGVLRRFAVDRACVLSELEPLFALAFEQAGADPETLKVVRFIERRQRSRAAAETGPWGSLENAVAIAADRGLDESMVRDMSVLCGVRPSVGARIFDDPGGEALAVLAKAVGLRQEGVDLLWRALRRPADESPGAPYARMLDVYRTVATAKAQTVLRYWNWSLTADKAPVEGADIDAEDADLDIPATRRAGALLLTMRAPHMANPDDPL